MSISSRQPKPKKCRVVTCGASFVPARLGQAVSLPSRNEHATLAECGAADHR